MYSDIKGMLPCKAYEEGNRYCYVCMHYNTSFKGIRRVADPTMKEQECYKDPEAEDEGEEG